MNTEVMSAPQATEIAHAFISKYYPFARPLSAIKEGSVWNVEINAGPLVTRIAKIKVDAATGKVLDYSVP